MSKREEVKRYIAVQQAFAKDSEKLLQKYTELQTFSFSTFAKLWTDMSFSLVFAGNSGYDEMRQYTEVFLFESKKYHILAKNIYLKAAALYLMYGLYYKQPIKEFVKIRIVKSEFIQLLEFITEMKRRHEAQPLYVYSKMMADDAFDFVYTQTMLAPDLKHFNENFVTNSSMFDGTVENVEKSLLQLLDNKDIRNVNNDYQNLLSEYLERNNENNLMVFKNNILDDLKRIYNDSKITSNDQNILETTQEDHESSSDIGIKRAELKNKAMQFQRKYKEERGEGSQMTE